MNILQALENVREKVRAARASHPSLDTSILSDLDAIIAEAGTLQDRAPEDDMPEDDMPDGPEPFQVG